MMITEANNSPSVAQRATTFRATLHHDAGKTRVTIYAGSYASVSRRLQELEGCPARSVTNVQHYTSESARKEYREHLDNLKGIARQMAHRVPRHFWCPGPGKMLTAGQVATIVKTLRKAAPSQEVAQSFQSWAPVQVADVLRWEVLPAIHERINARPFLTASHLNHVRLAEEVNKHRNRNTH